MQRIGIYSGTFDPVHAGHVAFAVASREMCKLGRVVFLPENQPRGKANVTPLAERIELLRLAVADEPRLQIEQLPQPQFSIDQTLPILTGMFPSAHLTLLIGSDVALGLKHWPGIERLATQVSFAIGLRATETAEQLVAVMDELAQLLPTPITYALVTTEYSQHNSSAVRQAQPALPEIASVRDYIQEHHLYPHTPIREVEL